LPDRKDKKTIRLKTGTCGLLQMRLQPVFDTVGGIPGESFSRHRLKIYVFLSCGKIADYMQLFSETPAVSAHGQMEPQPDPKVYRQFLIHGQRNPLGCFTAG